MDGQVPPFYLATADPAGWGLGSALNLLPLTHPQAPALSGPRLSCLCNGRNVLLGPGISGSPPWPRGQSTQDLGRLMAWVCILSPLLLGSETSDKPFTVSGPISLL